MWTVRRSITVLIVVVVLGAGGLVTWLLLNGGIEAAKCTVTGQDNASYSLTPEQAGNAATIAAVGNRLGMPAHAVTVALATAMQESKLHNLTGGDRDSAGLFQQRPSQGWGTYAQVTDPVYAATAFYQHLRQQSDWQDLSVTKAAQQVQHSATPDAYARWEPEARAVASALTGETQGALACQHLTINPATEDLATMAQNQWGTSTVTGAHGAAQNWAIGSWLVAQANTLGIDQVTVNGQTWTAASGSWAQTGPADGTVRLHQVPAAPPAS